MSTPGTHSPSRLAVGGFAAFALSIPLAGAFNPDYSHVREGISALAATDSPAAPIMIAGFLALVLVIAAMMTVGLGDLGGVVQRLFIALLFGAPVVLTGWRRTVAPVS